MKYIYYLSLGANLGDRLATIGKAVEALGQQGEIIRVSQMYETPPWGKLDQPAFINCAVVIVSKLVPVEFLHGCQRIEKNLGRVRHEHWGARTIDVDILCVQSINELEIGRQAIEDLLDSGELECPLLMMDTEELQLPHPYMLERAFVMVPLAEIAPQLVLANGKRAVEICYSLPDRENIVSLSTK